MKPLRILIRHLPTRDDRERVYSDPDAECPLLPVDEPALDRLQTAIGSLRKGRPMPLSIYSSPVKRATRTAELVLDSLCAGRPQVDERLSNIRHPQWNGLTQMDVSDTALYRRWHSQPQSVEFPGGESLADVSRRATSFLSDLGPDSDCLIVSHSTMLQVLTCHLLGISTESIWAFYYEPYAATVIADGVLMRFNDTSSAGIDVGALYE